MMHIKTLWRRMLNKLGLRDDAKRERERERQQQLLRDEILILEQEQKLIREQIVIQKQKKRNKKVMKELKLILEQDRQTMKEQQQIKELQLMRGQRYLFTEKPPHERRPFSYRANFAYIINNTICVHIHEKHGNIYSLSIPVSWIVKIESLDRITRELLRLPTEIMDIIDSYL